MKNLKNKLARLLRRWADKLAPAKSPDFGRIEYRTLDLKRWRIQTVVNTRKLPPSFPVEAAARNQIVRELSRQIIAESAGSVKFVHPQPEDDYALTFELELWIK